MRSSLSRRSPPTSPSRRLRGGCKRIAAKVVMAAAAAGGAVALSACEEGALLVSGGGSDEVINGIGADDTVDGGAIRFNRFLVSFDEVLVARAGGTVGGELRGPIVIDARAPTPQQLGLMAVDSGSWEAVSVAVVPAATGLVGVDIDSTLLELMEGQGFSVYVEGVVEQDAVAKTFAWGFDTNTRFADCGDVEGNKGVFVGDSNDLLTFTVDGGRLFADRLAAGEGPGAVAGDIRVEAILAADDNDDDVIDRDELDGVDLRDVADDTYDVVNESDVLTLGDFVRAQTRDLIRIGGNGPCTSQKR